MEIRNPKSAFRNPFRKRLPGVVTSVTQGCYNLRDNRSEGPMPIRVLPTHLVNKIAAGEVIERPASVVKELVENALDAGASRIDIAVEDGGKRLLRVTDDGAGMGPDDLALAFAPHATSKIASEDDLFAITTMGFRGEALASIASVSHASIRTRRRAAPAGGPDAAPPDAAGYEIQASGEGVSPVRPCAAAEGTSVAVADLFFNMPARRKFLRSTPTELGQIGDMLSRLALANPKVAFTLSHNGRAVQHLPAAGGTRARAEALFGEEVASSLLPLAERRGGAPAAGSPVRVAGLIGTPAAARPSGKWQFFFLNGRYVRDRLLSHALREAYRGLADPSRFPVAILFVEVDPAEVDVNVHPTKIEVRFRNGDQVHGELLAALRQTLNQARLSAPATIGGAGFQPAAGPQTADSGAAAALSSSRADGPARTVANGAAVAPGDVDPADAPLGKDEEDRRQSLRQAMADFFRSVPASQPRFSFPQGSPRRDEPGRAESSAPAATAAAPWRESAPPAAPSANSALRSEALRVAEQRTTSDPVGDLGASRTERGLPGETSFPPAAIQLHNAYLVTACEDGVLIYDQHALHERVLYNQFQRLLAEGRGLEGQRLLIPATLRASAAEADALAARADLLGRLGIEVAPFGPDTLAVQQFPSLLVARRVEEAAFVRELAERLGESPSASAEAVLEDVLAMMACKAAVKAGQPLSPGEIEHLLVAAGPQEKASACPHGRPAVLKLTLKDLEKQFKRT